MQTSSEVKLVLARIQLMHNLVVHLKGGREVIPVMIKHQVLTTVHHSYCSPFISNHPMPARIKPVTSRLEKKHKPSVFLPILTFVLALARTIFRFLLSASWSFGKENLNAVIFRVN